MDARDYAQLKLQLLWYSIKIEREGKKKFKLNFYYACGKTNQRETIHSQFLLSFWEIRNILRSM